jgi:hypothetical protein
MISNLSEYFKPELEIFLDTVSYKRIENLDNKGERELSLLCQDNLKATTNENGVRIIVTRTLMFDPEELFTLNVSFGADLKFNERKLEHEWSEINLAEEFGENGDFVTAQLMSRISLLIGQITSSFGQQPLILPSGVAKKGKTE